MKKNLMKDSKFEKENEETTFDNENGEVMEKLYKEIQLKYPRQIIEGQIKKYPFFLGVDSFVVINLSIFL